jgi:hypothetical protein
VGERSSTAETAIVTVTQTRTETLSAEGGDPMPAAINAKRIEILRAARARDWEALQKIIDRSRGEFSYTFGDPVSGGPIAYWKQLEQKGEKPLETLEAVLGLPYTLSRGIFVWPFAYDKTQDEISAYERHLLATIPGDATIGPEGYLGWRAGIRPDGRWVFFVAGD